MKRLILLLIAAVVSVPSAQTPAPAAAAGNHVVIISLDGFPAWALDDPYLPVPTLRRLAAAGASAKAMRPVDPTVTWANHTSMVTGVTPARHRVIFNGLLIREPGVPPRVEPWRDRNDMVKAPTVYDLAHQRGLTTAQVDWVAILNAPTITWEFPERPDPKGTIAGEMVKAGLVAQADVEAFSSRNILYRDQVWTDAAAYILRQHKPNLMMFHLLNLDSTHHRYGPRTPAGMTAMALLDSQVGTIVEALEDSGMMPRTTILVVSDHGFKTVKRQIRANAALREAGLITVQQDKVQTVETVTTVPTVATVSKITRADAYSVAEGGTALVYVTVPDASGAIARRVKETLQGLEGVAAVVEPAEYAKYGLPHPDQSDQTGAFFLVARDGYAFTNDTASPAVVDATGASLGSHGYVASDPDLRAIFIASGRGIRPGVRLDEVANLDLAPTMARLLGFEMPNVEGRVLTEILSLPAAAPPR